MNIATNTFSKIDKLIDAWCERRMLKPLRFILKNYPLHSYLTDEWGALLESLKDIKGLCVSDLTNEEKKVLIEVINIVDNVVHGERQEENQITSHSIQYTHSPTEKFSF